MQRVAMYHVRPIDNESFTVTRVFNAPANLVTVTATSNCNCHESVSSRF